MSKILKQPNSRRDNGTTTRWGQDNSRRPEQKEGRNRNPASAERNASKSKNTSRVSSRANVKRADIILFVNQMAVLLETGVPLSEAVQGIAGRAVDPKYRAIMEEITVSVESGNPLSNALAKYPNAFPPIMIALVRASEASGTMGVMLNRIAAYLTKEYQTLKQVRGALIYPAFMLLMCVSVTVLLLTFVLPQFAGIYANQEATLPAPTRILMGVSDQLVSNWVYWLTGTFVFALLTWIWSKTRIGQIQIDWLKLNVPVFSTMFSKLYLSRGCRTIGTMVESGVSLLDTVVIAKDVTQNVYYERLWDQIDSDLRSGKPLSDALYEYPVIPDYIAQMVESGEKSGRLSQVFNRVADFTEAEFDQAVKTATQFIEPVMIVTMGSIIGFIAVALLIPIFSIGTVVSGN